MPRGSTGSTASAGISHRFERDDREALATWKDPEYGSCRPKTLGVYQRPTMTVSFLQYIGTQPTLLNLSVYTIVGQVRSKSLLLTSEV